MMEVVCLLILMNSFLLVTSFYVLNLNQVTLLTTLSCTKRLDELSRTEIQAIAKNNNIRANLKTSEILAELNVCTLKKISVVILIINTIINFINVRNWESNLLFL